jgi:putative membrane protein
MKKQVMGAVALGALMLAPVVSYAQNTQAGTPASDQDNMFIQQAAMGGRLEISTSRLALKKTSDQGIKDFANEMITDHKAADDKLMKLVKKDNLTKPPKGLDAEHKAMLDGLKKLSGGDFDAQYKTIQDKGHMEAVAAFQKEADTGTNADLKAFAQATLPTLQHHVDALKKLEMASSTATTTMQK